MTPRDAAAAAGARFAAMLGEVPLVIPAGILGLEHEFAVHADGKPVDFRDVIGLLELHGRAVDPADPWARRLPSGGVITCDEREAEIAIAPVAMRGGFSEAVVRRAARLRVVLESAMPGGYGLTGYSTHISVAMPDALNDAACDLYARRFAPALMLLMDHQDAPGLLIRPRPGRLELGGSYVDGMQLRSAVAFAAGSAKACADVAAGELDPRTLPPALRVDIEPAVSRYGWYVGRNAFGPDLYRESRRARLTTETGEGTSAAHLLAVAWASARTALGPFGTGPDANVVDAIVAADLPLPSERLLDSPAWTLGEDAAPSPFGALLSGRRRPGFAVEVEASRWQASIFRIVGKGRTVFASVPGALLDTFLLQLDAGALDEPVLAFLDAGPSGRILASNAQTASPGLFDTVATSAVLIAPERVPITGDWYIEGTKLKPRTTTYTPAETTTTQGFRPWIPWVGGGIIALLATLTAIGIVVTRDGSASTQPPGAVTAPASVVESVVSGSPATVPGVATASETAVAETQLPSGPVAVATPPAVTVTAPAAGAASPPAAGAGPSPSPSPSLSASPSSSPSPSPAAPLNTGTYHGAITVLSDPFGHAPFIGPMPATVDVLFTRGTTTGTVTITISGAAPWLQVRGVGTYNATSGAFTATGSGLVTANQIAVTAEFSGTLKNGTLVGNLTLTGTPNGPITYHVQMTKQ